MADTRGLDVVEYLLLHYVHAVPGGSMVALFDAVTSEERMSEGLFCARVQLLEELGLITVTVDPETHMSHVTLTPDGRNRIS